MGLFSIDAVKFAEYVLAVYGGGAGAPVPQGKQYPRECERLIKQCHEKHGEWFSERIYLLANAGDRLMPRNSYEHYLKIQCYLFAGASSRQKAIATIPSYLEKRECGVPITPEFLDFHFEHLTSELAKCYKGEKMYKEALTLFADLHEADPSSFSYITEAADCLVQIRKPLEAMKILVSQKKTKYYFQEYRYNYFGNKEDFYFKKFIDRAILKTGSAIVKERDRMNYEWLQSNLSNLCPKSFSGYRRMKNQKTKNFLRISEKCKEHGVDIEFADEYDLLDEQWKKLVNAEKEAHANR